MAGFALSLGLAFAQKSPAPRPGVVATVQGTAITDADIEKAAAEDLERLELQRLQFEANYERSRHQVLEASLARLIKERVLATGGCG